MEHSCDKITLNSPKSYEGELLSSQNLLTLENGCAIKSPLRKLTVILVKGSNTVIKVSLEQHLFLGFNFSFFHFLKT